MKFFSVILFLPVLVLFSCTQGYFIDKDEKTVYPKGRDLFASKCSGCHNLPNPLQFTNSEWDSILVPMRNKAKLSDEEHLKIFNWLTENRSDTVITEKIEN